MTDITASSQDLITPELPDQLLAYLRGGETGIVLSVCEDGYPTSAFTWVIALNSKCIRLIADHGGRTLANLQRDRRAVIQIIGPDNLVFLVRGTTRQIKKDLDTAPIKAALFEMDVIGARDQSWSAATPAPLAFQWADEVREAMLKVEQSAYAKMREATG